MPLPDVPLRTGSVTIGGTEVPIRALSRSAVMRLRRFDGLEDEAEPFIVSEGTGVPIEEATGWLGSVDHPTGSKLIAAILEITPLLDPQEASTGAGPTEPPSNEA